MQRRPRPPMELMKQIDEILDQEETTSDDKSSKEPLDLGFTPRKRSNKKSTDSTSKIIPTSDIVDIEVDTQVKMINPYLSPFEKARIIAFRAETIAMDEPIFVNPRGETDPLKIARMELEQRKIPIVIRRRLPNGDTYSVKASELLFDIK